MRDTNSTLRARNVSFWDMERQLRVIDSTILKRKKVFYSRDVKFNENEKEKETQEFSDSDIIYRMELDFSDNTEEIETPFENQNETVLRRSERQRQPPDYYGVRVNLINETLSEPKTIEEATACSEKSKWIGAMKSLKENEVWELMELPKGRKTVGSKWVYKLKTGADGSVERYKARLLLHRDSHKSMELKRFVLLSEWNPSEP